MVDLTREEEEREAAAIVGFSEAREMGFGVTKCKCKSISCPVRVCLNAILVNSDLASPRILTYRNCIVKFE